MAKPAVTLTTLESHNHIVGDITRGVGVYEQGKIEFMEQGQDHYIASVPDKGSFKTASLTFTRDGLDLKQYYCDCTRNDKAPPVCRHIVAAVLAIQGGVAETKLVLGKTATATVVVGAAHTAKAVGSGSLDVFATPMMAALMEQAACACLADCLEQGHTTVGTHIGISHTAASPIGAVITATATIAHVFGRRIELEVTAADGTGEIGSGMHSRAIVDADRFMQRVLTSQ